MSTLRILSRCAINGVNHFRNTQCCKVRNLKRWVVPTLKELEVRRKKMPPPDIPRSQFLEWNYKAEWYAFGKRLQEEFNEDLLQKAFTHRSYIVKEEMLQKEAGIENPDVQLEDNSILIEKGNLFMDSYIKRYVSLLLPNFPQEGIKAVSDHLIQDDVLAYVAKHLGTKDLILSADIPPEEQTFADTLKAVVGALLESSGPERAGLFVRDFVVTTLYDKDVNEVWKLADPLSTLNSIMEREGRGKPEPRLINEAGRNTILRVYHVGLFSDKQFLGSGAGDSIPVAVEVAAHDALRRLFNTTDSMAPFNFKLNPYSEEVMPPTFHPSILDWKSSDFVKV